MADPWGGSWGSSWAEGVWDANRWIESDEVDTSWTPVAAADTTWTDQ